jgi:hypothetical protein
MAYVTARVDRRQSYCPDCRMIRGIPFRVQAGPQLLVIAYCCPSCTREWVVPSPPRDVRLQVTQES